MNVVWYDLSRQLRFGHLSYSVLLGVACFNFNQETTKTNTRRLVIMRITEAWLQYEADRRLDGFSPYTLSSYKIQANLLASYFNDSHIQDITTEQIKQYLAAQTHLKPASLGHRIKFIKTLYRWAQDEGHLNGANPAAKLREPKTGKKLPKAINEEDTEMLREACETPFEHAVVETFYNTGCRIGEIYLLNRSDIDWERRAIIVTGKGDKEREVYFTVKANIWLKKYLQSRLDDDPALFVTQRKFNLHCQEVSHL